MYSGTTLTSLSGRLLGGHQKIDRIARKHLEQLAPACSFPAIKQILHFEGGNGPDAIKRKSPAVDEPWHYFQPFDENDTQILELIQHHYDSLIIALRNDDSVRAGFESAWLAHALVDGLTPAHHYPYEEKLVELRSGKGIDERTTIKGKLVLPGETRGEQLKNNWKMWGPKGLMTTHGTFEWGVATLIAPLSLKNALPNADELEEFRALGIQDWYRRIAKEIAAMGLYDSFYERGWTSKLASKIRKQLAPTIVRAVTVTWYGALMDAQKAKKNV
ncbi:MAG: hypothetical protein ABIR37_03885 [Candidatus Saccharimonadales bacterium]